MEAAMTREATLGGVTVGTRNRSLGAVARRTLKKPQFWFGLIVLVPLAIFYIWFGFGPILRAFWMATVDYNLLAPEKSAFVGLKHFRMLFEYSLFWTSIQRTVTYAVSV
jgi:ABC-type sugar transport system permease subunit